MASCYCTFQRLVEVVYKNNFDIVITLTMLLTSYIIICPKLDIVTKFSDRNSKLPSKEAREKLFDGHDYDFDGVNDHGVVDEMVKPKFSGFIDCEAIIGLDFESFGIEKEGEITVDNFVSDFICGSIIDTRKMSLDALREGLTLGGK